MGPFVAAGPPEIGLAPGAFGGKFNAHVAVGLESPMLEVKLNARIPSGPKSPVEVKALLGQLHQGRAASAALQEAWGVSAEAAADAASIGVESFDDDAAIEGIAADDVMEQVESSEDGSVLKVPVKDRSLRALAPEARTDLEGDLLKLKEDSGVSIDLQCHPSMPMDSLVLRGDPEEVKSIKEWLLSILPFYDVDIDE